MKIQHDDDTFCSHIVNDFLHNIQSFKPFEVIIAVNIIFTVAELNGCWYRIIENHIQRKGNSDSIEFVARQKIDDEFIIYSPKPMDSINVGLESEPWGSFKIETFLVYLEYSILARIVNRAMNWSNEYNQ